ncbi:unnamed protein product [Blepharisma stoltei]|uniref:Uncharacterized protein n=1 Tax=Blepharisma stoltei TaxID=1481888 RepID=A0AAU9JJP1_9CILI|nr:unnamed protein product [Blepharisma stoltei]
MLEKFPPIGKQNKEAAQINKLISKLTTIQDEVTFYKDKTHKASGDISRIITKAEKLTFIKEPYFTKSEKYLQGKESISRNLNNETDLNKERQITSLIEDDDPHEKRYISPSMLFDQDFRKAFKKRKREFGFSEKPLSPYKFSFIPTSPGYVEQKTKKMKPKLALIINKKLGDIMYNNTYKNSAKHLIDDYIHSHSNHKKMKKNSSVSVLPSPSPTRGEKFRRRSTKDLSINIRDEVRKKTEEIGKLKAKLSKFLLKKKKHADEIRNTSGSIIYV